MFLIDRLYGECEYIFRNGQNYSEKASERGDLYVKQFIENIIHDRASKYDPYLVNRSAVISWGGTSVVLGKAQITGLSTLHRTNICALTEVGNRLFINTNLGAGPLSYRRQINFKFGNFERKAVALISINEIKVSVDFSIEKETGRNGFLLDFTINELNGFKLRMNGSVYFNWIINLFLNFWTLVLGRLIRNQLENELKQYIFVRLPKYQFPAEGISYRNGLKFNIPHKDIQNNENSKWTRLSPIDESSSFDRYISTEYGTAKNFVCNKYTNKTSRSFLQTHKWISEMNNYLPAQSISSCSGSLPKNSCSGDSKGKAEGKCDPNSLLSETVEISRSLNKMKEKFDSIFQAPNSPSRRMTSNNHLNALEDDEDNYSLSDCDISDDLIGIDKIDSNSRESKDTATATPGKGFENAQLFRICKRREEVEKESKMEDFSQMLRDSCRYLVEKGSKDAEQNMGHSKLLKEIFSEIYERSCRKNDSNLLNRGTKLQSNVANYDSFPSTVIESSQIDENILQLEAEPSSITTGALLNQYQRFDPEMTKAQITQDEKMFSEERKKTEDSNKNVLVESCKIRPSLEINLSASNLDFQLNSTETFQNDFRNSCTVDELEKDKVYYGVLRQEIDDSESIKGYHDEILFENQGVGTFEARCISEDGVDNQTGFKPNITCDSIQLTMIQDELSFDSETETASPSTQFSEKHENEAEKISFSYMDFDIFEVLKEDSLLKADDTAYNSSSKEELNISSKLLTDGATDNLLVKLANVLNERDIECPDCVVEFSSIAGLELNAGSNKDCLGETPDPKALHDLLQEEIIAKIRKLTPNALGSDKEDGEYSASFTISNHENQNETEELVYDERNLSLKDSKTNDLEITSVLKGNCASLSVTERPILNCKTLSEIGFVSDSETEITELAPSERNESKHV